MAEGIFPPQRPADATIRRAFDALGFPQPDQPIVVGLRRAEQPGEWNDLIGVFGGGISLWFNGTTDPGRRPMEGGRGVHSSGVARITPGYHHDMWGWGWHKGHRRHPCLKQKSPVQFERYRRGSWNLYAPDVRGFNLHRARWEGTPEHVGHYSHGCIVIPDRREHWQLCKVLGYPDPPFTAEQEKHRIAFCLIDWSAYVKTLEV